MKSGTKWMLGLAVLIGVAAGTTLYYLLEADRHKQKPPKKAPQLDLENPGSQSEFPTAASDSELG